MSTDAFKGLLDRDGAIATASDLIDIACPALREIINYSTNALARCMAVLPRSEDATDIYVAPFALFWRSIQLTDAIEVVLSRSCVDGAIPSLRSSFETTLSLKYLLEADEERRSLAWLCGNTHQRLRMYRRIREQQGLSDELSAMLEDDCLRDLDQQIQRLEDGLDKSHMQETVSEYGADKRVRRNWYASFGGPDHLRELAEHLDWSDYYEICYRSWSSDAHANASITRVFTLTQGRQTMHSIRYPQEILSVAAFAGSFLLESLLRMTTRFRPEEEGTRAEWYKSMRPFLDRVHKTKVKIDASLMEGW